jgi:glycine/D-amino acid oxidase-like deaminating enzyme
VLVGGADIAFKNPAVRDRRLPSRIRVLRSRYAKMFPDEPEFVPEFAWTGTFGESADGLPYIGPFAGAPGCLLAMGFGGNGITWAMLATELLCDRLCGRANPIEPLFAFDRAKS